MTVNLILKNYPIKSIKNIEKPWDKKIFKLNNISYSLNDIEHKILRKMDEPRIHFAVNCAAIGCPPLRAEAYLGKSLDQQFDLIMINRLMDLDRSEGMAILHELKSNPQTENTPAMIISDYQDAQEAAVAAGASPGFGKARLDTPQTFELLSNFLQAEGI